MCPNRVNSEGVPIELIASVCDGAVCVCDGVYMVLVGRELRPKWVAARVLELGFSFCIFIVQAL